MQLIVNCLVHASVLQASVDAPNTADYSYRQQARVAGLAVRA